MKKILVLLIFLIGFIACNKENDNKGLIGKWKIDNVSGGLHGNGYTPHFKYMYLIENGTCKWTDNEDKWLVDGTYELSTEAGKNYIQFEKMDTTIYSFYTHKFEYEFLTSDSLYLDQGCADCYNYTFIRVK